MTEKSLFCGINNPADSSNLTDMEKKHVPVIEAPDTVTAGEAFEVTVKVGSTPHVMEVVHHIQWIDLYSGGNFITKVILTPVFMTAKVTINMVKSGAHETATLRAVSRCNVHGMWESEKVIAVK
ncbi:MAG: class II SORL domain-containing protein [Methanosarcinaceae archaeon]|nr:class II SORL domain-containing protein [Methanosarcinaceae archaeon]